MEDEIEEKLLLRKNLKIELDELKQTIQKEEELWNVHYELSIRNDGKRCWKIKRNDASWKSLRFKELELESQMNRLKQEAEQINNHSTMKHFTNTRFNASGLFVISSLVITLLSLMLLSNPLLKDSE